MKCEEQCGAYLKLAFSPTSASTARYYESPNTPGLWRHESRPLTFTLVVDDFGIKFVNKAYVDHLISSIKTAYTLMED